MTRQIRKGFDPFVETKYKRKTPRTKVLGDVLDHFVEKNVTPRYGRSEQIKSIWQQLLPEQLAGYCRIKNFEGGVLTIVAQSPSYLHELRLCKGHLKKEMNKQLRGTRIKEIRFMIG